MDKLHVQRTYAEVVIGRPDEDRNNKIRNRFEALASGIHNSHKPFVIEPTIDTSNKTPRLPAFSCMAFFSHPEPVHDRNSHMSHAAIVWYQESNPLVHGLDIVNLARELAWTDVARDGTR